MKWLQGDAIDKRVELQETPYKTIQRFVIWATPLYPAIDDRATFEDIIDLAIFAEVHEAELLHNQSIDILREELGNSGWKIAPHIVKRVYSSLGDGAKLRKLVGSLLWHARQDMSKSNEQDMADHDTVVQWGETIGLTSDIVRDYYLSSCAQRAIKQVKEGGPCRFHWHKGIDEETLSSIDSSSCPYTYLGRFPLGVMSSEDDPSGTVK